MKGGAAMNIMKIIFVYVAALLLFLLTPFKASALNDYDVDWPPSNEKGIHVLAITIDGCETRFKVKDKDFEKFSSNGDALDQALKKALDRANSGCQN